MAETFRQKKKFVQQGDKKGASVAEENLEERWSGSDLGLKNTLIVCWVAIVS